MGDFSSHGNSLLSLHLLISLTSSFSYISNPNVPTMVSGILVETVPQQAPTAGSSKMLVTTAPGPLMPSGLCRHLIHMYTHTRKTNLKQKWLLEEFRSNYFPVTMTISETTWVIYVVRINRQKGE